MDKKHTTFPSLSNCLDNILLSIYFEFDNNDNPNIDDDTLSTIRFIKKLKYNYTFRDIIKLDELLTYRKLLSLIRKFNYDLILYSFFIIPKKRSSFIDESLFDDDDEDKEFLKIINKEIYLLREEEYFKDIKLPPKFIHFITHRDFFKYKKVIYICDFEEFIFVRSPELKVQIKINLLLDFISKTTSTYKEIKKNYYIKEKEEL